MIKIDGVEIPTPSDFRVGHQDILKAERNAKGTLIAEFIARKVKLEFSWRYLTNAEMQLVLNAIDPLFFTVEYPDPKENGMKTLTFYKGDRNVAALDYIDDQIRWKDFKFDVIER